MRSLGKKALAVDGGGYGSEGVCPANFSILINGHPRGKIHSKRGLRQGDSISPFLFTLIGYSFSCLIHFCCEKRVIRGFEIGSKKELVSHLQYADDTIGFCSNYKGNLDRWWKVIYMFIKGSGLRINLTKTSLIGLNLSERSMAYRAARLGCRVETLPFKYL